MERGMSAKFSLSAPGGGEGRGEVGEDLAPDRGPTHPPPPPAHATGPPPPPPARGGGGGGGGGGEALAPARGPTHLPLPVANATGPLPPPPEGGEGTVFETEEELNRRHNEKMARRKAARDRMLATKTEERG